MSAVKNYHPALYPLPTMITWPDVAMTALLVLLILGIFWIVHKA